MPYDRHNPPFTALEESVSLDGSNPNSDEGGVMIPLLSMFWVGLEGYHVGLLLGRLIKGMLLPDIALIIRKNFLLQNQTYLK